MSEQRIETSETRERLADQHIAKLLIAVLERGGEFEGLGVRVKLPPPKPAVEPKEPHLSRLGAQLATRKALLTEE